MRDSPLELFSLRAGFIGLAMALFSVGSMAQRPPPSLFKCEEGGVVRYSDAPCQDGVKLQLGRSRDPASAPQVGSQTAPSLQLSPRRKGLSEETQRECARLELDRRKHEDFARSATGAARESMQTKLAKVRLRQKELGC
jgi:hypothetical protein